MEYISGSLGEQRRRESMPSRRNRENGFEIQKRDSATGIGDGGCAYVTSSPSCFNYFKVIRAVIAGRCFFEPNSRGAASLSSVCPSACRSNSSNPPRYATSALSKRQATTDFNSVSCRQYGHPTGQLH